MELFCYQMMEMYPIALDGTDCSDLDTAETARPFFSKLNTVYSEMDSYPVGIRSFSETVCV
jgi:hypothetical protein